MLNEAKNLIIKEKDLGEILRFTQNDKPTSIE
jgi:hypothetical protein